MRNFNSTPSGSPSFFARYNLALAEKMLTVNLLSSGMKKRMIIELSRAVELLLVPKLLHQENMKIFW